MIKKIKKYFLLIPTLALAFVLISTPASAAILKPGTLDKINASADQTGAQAGYEGTTDVAGIVANLIKTALSLLGVIFVVLVILSGYQWMTAGGDEKVIETAKSRIKNAVIGLVIVLAAYSITNFVFNNLSASTGGSNSGGAVDTTVTGGTPIGSPNGSSAGCTPPQYFDGQACVN
ncbi:MAG: pilin [Candidatus Falkowbacteria bacterium]